MATPPINPNLITTLRLPIAPLAVFALISEYYIIAAVLALVLEVTDVADGHIARKYDCVTTFGKLYDPFSDAFSRYTLFLGFFGAQFIIEDMPLIMDLWMIIAIFYRDAAVSFLRTIAATRNFVLSARLSGKIKAVVQGVGTQVVFLLLVLTEYYPESTQLAAAPWWVMFVVTIATMLSFVDYFVGNLPLLKAAWHDEPVK